MAHVQIHAKAASIIDGVFAEDHEFSLKIDGIEIGPSVMADGFAIEWPDDFPNATPIVCLRLSADVLDGEIPRSLLDAVVTKAGA